METNQVSWQCKDKNKEERANVQLQLTANQSKGSSTKNDDMQVLNDCSQRQTEKIIIGAKASNSTNSLSSSVHSTTPTPTHPAPSSRTHGFASTSKSVDDHASKLNAMNSSSEKDLTKFSEQEMKPQANEVGRETIASNYYTDTCASTLNDSRNSSTPPDKTKSKSDEVVHETSQPSAHENASSPNNDSSMSSTSTDLLYRAMHNDRSLNDSSSSSSAWTDQLISSSDKSQSKGQDSRQNKRKRKRTIVHPTAQDLSVSSLGSSVNSSSAAAVLAARAQHDSSSPSTGSGNGSS